MRIRSLTLLSVLVLVVAACGTPDGEDTTTTVSPAETTTIAPAVEAVALSYSLEAGNSYEYEVTLDQTIEMTTIGDTAALGEGEDVPGEMSININGTAPFAYSVADGPEPDTYEVTITGDFSDLEFSGTVDGEPADQGEIPDVAEMEPIDVTVVVDEQGNLIKDDTGAPGGDLLGGLGGLGMLDQFSGGGNIGQFVGPPLTEEEVSVGDTWSETVETPLMPGDDPLTTQIDSEVVGTDTVDGNDVFVIDTTSTTSAFEVDLGELLVGMMSGFAPDDASEADLAEMDAMLEQIKFVFSIDEAVSNMTTYFDYEAGLARQADITGDIHMVMDINMPDETTGELVEFAMDMTISQNTSFVLTNSTSA